MNLKRAQIERQIDRLTAELARLDSLPEDEFETEDVLFFKKQFDGHNQVYTYVAVKIGRLWYITGSANRTEHTWESLLEFVGDAELWHASEWEQVQ